LCLGGILLAASAGQAQGDDVSAAANAFAQAQRAELSGDSARAAELYELADSIAPTPEALRNAARAWFNADRLVPAATAAEQLRGRYGNDAVSRQLADEILAKAGPRLGRVQTHCEQPCTLSIDGLAVGTEARQTQTVYLEPGGHTLLAHFEAGETAKQRLDAKAGESVQVTLAPQPGSTAPLPAPVAEQASLSTAPAKPEADEPKRRGQLSPAYFWVGLSASAALGAVTIWSGIDLLNARDDFEKNESPTRKAFDAGEGKDLRTTVLIASTAAVAATTAILAIFTDFKGTRRSNESASRRPHRALAEAGRSTSPAATWAVGADSQGGHLIMRKAF
jgi:hypothetical protein